MGEAFITRRGGNNPLNFNVVGGTSAPSNPKENTIWVNTDREITSWHFGPEEPNAYDIQCDKNADGSANATTLLSPHVLSDGEILNFVIPHSLTNITNWLVMADTYNSWYRYAIRNLDGTLPSKWEKGTKVGLRISYDSTSFGDYTFRTAYIVTYGSYTAEEGVVCIQTGTNSPVEFNALKKNGIQIYPLSAKQFIGGTGVVKTAKTYQGGAWQEWIPTGALYFHGNKCVNTSGGWVARGWVWGGSITNTIVPSVAFNADHMQITLGSGNLVAGAVEVVKDQDLTSVSKLTIDFEATTYAYMVKLLVISRSTSYMDEAVCSVDLQPSGDQQTVAQRTVSLDVSGVSGSYDVVIAFVNAWSGGCNATMKVYSVLKE